MTAPGPTDAVGRCGSRGAARPAREVAKAVVGQDAAVTGLVIALLCRGHVLLEGVPGVAKTLLVRALAAALSLDTKRVQFTPDLMPGDVTGSLVYDAAHRRVLLPRGAGLHQPAARRRDQPHAAQDPGRAAGGDGGAAGHRRRASRGRCPTRSSSCATQNPVEYEGTYPLPEAQLDRFLLKLTMPLPDARRRDRGPDPARRRLRPARPRRRRRAAGGRRRRARGRSRPRCARVALAPEVLGYVVDLARATRSLAVAAAGRVPARRDRAAVRRPGLGLAVRPRLRHARRRQGAGPPGPAAPRARCAPRPSWRASPPTPCSTACSAAVPVPR